MQKIERRYREGSESGLKFRDAPRKRASSARGGDKAERRSALFHLWKLVRSPEPLTWASAVHSRE